MEKFTYNIKFPPVFVRVTVGRNPGGPFYVLNFNAIYRGVKNVNYLPMAPSKMEAWLRQWAIDNQKMLQNLFDNRTENWNDIFEKGKAS